MELAEEELRALLTEALGEFKTLEMMPFGSTVTGLATRHHFDRDLTIILHDPFPSIFIRDTRKDEEIVEEFIFKFKGEYLTETSTFVIGTNPRHR